MLAQKGKARHQWGLHCCYKEEYSLRIPQRFPKLRPLPVTIGGDGLVLSHSVECDLFFAWSEPPSIRVVVGHEVSKNERGRQS